jgi:hypothetical protein
MCRPYWLILRQRIYLFFLICIVGGGVQTGSTRHVGHSLAYCTCPGWLWGLRIWWNEWQGKPKYSEKTWPDATLSTTNPTWPDPGLKTHLLEGTSPLPGGLLSAHHISLCLQLLSIMCNTLLLVWPRVFSFPIIMQLILCTCMLLGVSHSFYRVRDLCWFALVVCAVVVV